MEAIKSSLLSKERGNSFRISFILDSEYRVQIMQAQYIQSAYRNIIFYCQLIAFHLAFQCFPNFNSYWISNSYVKAREVQETEDYH